MQHASATRLVRAAPAGVWATLADVTKVASWHPSVGSADLLSARPTGLGAARRCNFYDGTSVREEVVELEEGRRLRMRLTEFSMPMKRIEAEFSVAPTDAGFSEVTFTVFFEVKWGALGRLMGALMVRRELTAMAAKVLAGLDHHVTTGETVGKGFVPAAAQAQ